MKAKTIRSTWGAGAVLFLLFFISCKSNSQSIDNKSLESESKAKAQVLQSTDIFTDDRDGETYKTVKIGPLTWMAENLRYNSKGSMVNPAFPNKSYGRLYFIGSAQSACPDGWHLPSDREWDEVEMAHGMPFTFIKQGGWRGEHAINMRSTSEWGEDGNGTNQLGFNVLPAGYYFGPAQGELLGLDGLGFSAAFWSSVEDGVGQARFMFSTRLFVNKWPDTNDDSGAALSCRCVKD